jgi:hypothetical protein
LTSLRYFIADDVGELTAMPQARWHRIIQGKESLPQYAGRDIRYIEAVVEVERRVIRRVLRVLPIRMSVQSDGYIDVDRQMRRAMERMSSSLEPVTAEKAIRDLEIDANRFWILNESHWWKLSELLGVSVENLKAALYRASRDE